MMMVCKRGGIYLANFNPSKGTEAGKIRPCLVVQNDLLNEAHHPSTTVIPLTFHLTDNAAPLRFRVSARGNLETDSDVMLDQTRTIDNKRMTSDLIATLTERELTLVEEYWKIVLGLRTRLLTPKSPVIPNEVSTSIGSALRT